MADFDNGYEYDRTYDYDDSGSLDSFEQSAQFVEEEWDYHEIMEKGRRPTARRKRELSEKERDWYVVIGAVLVLIYCLFID